MADLTIVFFLKKGGFHMGVQQGSKRGFRLGGPRFVPTPLCHQCEYPSEAHDPLLRNVIVIELRFKEAYCKCIENCSVLTLEETIEIAQNQDATAHQVSYMRPEFKGNPLNFKETGTQEPSGTDSSHKDQVPMNSSI